MSHKIVTLAALCSTLFVLSACGGATLEEGRGCIVRYNDQYSADYSQDRATLYFECDNGLVTGDFNVDVTLGGERFRRETSRSPHHKKLISSKTFFRLSALEPDDKEVVISDGLSVVRFQAPRDGEPQNTMVVSICTEEQDAATYIEKALNDDRTDWDDAFFEEEKVAPCVFLETL